MAILKSDELLKYSLAIDALRDDDLLHERMPDISPRYTHFTVNTDLIGVYWLEDEIIIAANGSNTLREWFDNLKIRKTKLGFHRGFYATAEKAFSEIMSMHAVQNNHLPITFTGHSRGGYTLIVNALLKRLGEHKRASRTITFGSPRVGNRKACKLLGELGVEHHRVHADHDFVDNLAPGIFGYRHYETEEYKLGTKRWRLDHTSYSDILKEEIECQKK